MRIEPIITAPEGRDPVISAQADAALTGPAAADLRPDGPEIGAGAGGMTPIPTRIARFIFRAVAVLAGLAAIAALGVFVLSFGTSPEAMFVIGVTVVAGLGYVLAVRAQLEVGEPIDAIPLSIQELDDLTLDGLDPGHDRVTGRGPSRYGDIEY